MQRSFLARHALAFALGALLLDVLVVAAADHLPWSVVPGFHHRIVAPRAVPFFAGGLVILAAVHVLLALAAWQRLRARREPSSRSFT